MTTTPLLLLLLALAVVALVLAGGWLWLRSRSSGRTEGRSADHVDTVTGWSPQATRVLSGAERDAFEILRKALPAHTILAQVPLARFIKVPTRNSYAEWLRRVGHQCADFVVCDRHAQVIAVVELQPDAPSTSERAAPCSYIAMMNGRSPVSAGRKTNGSDSPSASLGTFAR